MSDQALKKEGIQFVSTNEAGNIEEEKQMMKQGSMIEGMRLLKQQAKQLLLKGCYLMASNKYIKVIDMGIGQFAPRQQAIIYLNCGMCFQFMSSGNKDNFVKALSLMKSAIQADSSYQKTYYRLIQHLRDNGFYQTALSIVPAAVKNKQIDSLLKQVRELYMQQMDFTAILQKFKSKEVNPSNVSVVCHKLEQTVNKILEANSDKDPGLYDQRQKKDIMGLGQQIGLFYTLIGSVDPHNKAQVEASQSRTQSMQQFTFLLTKLFCARLQNTRLIPFIDLLIQPTMKRYRGQLLKYLNSQLICRSPNLRTPSTSEFVSCDLVLTSKRTIFHQSQLKLVKYIRLIDIDLDLFGKTYCYLSQQASQTTSRRIKGENVQYIPTKLFCDNKLLHKFLTVNSISVEQVISHSNPSRIKSRAKQLIVYGGHPQRLYNNTTKEQLNQMKKILFQQCQLLAAIYESPCIHPVWLQSLHQLLFSVNGLLSIILNMVQIYSVRQSRNSTGVLNEITEITNLSHLIYIQNWQVQAYNQKLKQQSKDRQLISQNEHSQLFKLSKYKFFYSYEQLLSYFSKQNDNFVAYYLFEKIVQFIHKDSNFTKQDKIQSHTQKLQNKTIYKQRIIEICLQKVEYVREKLKKTNQQLNSVYKEMYLILICIILKVDIKKQIQIDRSIFIKQVYKDVVSDIALEVLLLILINKPSYITYYLESQKDITKLVKHFLAKPLIQQIQPFRILLNVIYILICDFEYDQQKYFAERLGVTQQQVHQVRKLQKQIINEKQKQQLTKLKKNFKNQVSIEWLQILNQLCRLVRTTLKMESYCSIKLCTIIYSIAQVNHSKLYSGQIIQFMLEARNVKDHSRSLQFNIKQTACRFFQLICKKCNAQIFQYKHLQGIVDSLLWLVSNSQHQLIFFESLLGLVNLSTMSVKLPIEEIQKCLYQENSYIVHAGVCVMNNVLIYSEQLQSEEQKNNQIKSRISDLIYKYIQFYRDQIITLESQLPESDYSHPKKIYNSLISLATVLKLDKLEELQSWEKSKKYIKILANNQASQLLFKLTIYHSLENQLPRNWERGFEVQLQILKTMEPQKYAKLTQLM